ncbi:tyrosine-type recombinase/integrase [Archaeoglobus sp.]
MIYVRKLLKEAGADFVDKIQLPKMPKRRREVVKRDDVKRLIERIRSLDFKLHKQRLMQQRVIAGLLIMATSGLRPEELYNLSIDEIDVENRTIRLKIGETASGKTIKDYEERVTFFSEEAKQELLKLLDMWNDGKPLFNVRSFYSMWEYHLRD